MPNIYGLELNVIIAYAFGLILIYLLGRIFFMPLKIVFKLIYNAIIGAIILVALNFIGGNFDFTIAINPVTALVVGFLGVPGIALLILFKMLFGSV